MKIFSFITIMFLLIALNGCKTSITGEAVITETEDSKPKQIIIPVEQYSSNFDFFDADKIQDGDLTQTAWRGNNLNKYILLDAGENSYAFTGISAYYYNGKYLIQYSDNNIDWTTAIQPEFVPHDAYLINGLYEQWVPYKDFLEWQFEGYRRYWRILFTNNYDTETRGYEIQWWGYAK